MCIRVLTIRSDAFFWSGSKYLIPAQVLGVLVILGQGSKDEDSVGDCMLVGSEALLMSLHIHFWGLRPKYKIYGRCSIVCMSNDSQVTQTSNIDVGRGKDTNVWWQN